MRDYCPCDLCNGLLTGAWEDEPYYEEWGSLYEEYDDPYAGMCAACGVDLVSEGGVAHTMNDCPSPWWWSAYEGDDREARCREDQARWAQEK